MAHYSDDILENGLRMARVRVKIALWHRREAERRRAIDKFYDGKQAERRA